MGSLEGTTNQFQKLSYKSVSTSMSFIKGESAVELKIGKGAFFPGLALVFITLKLLHKITWPWVWVLSPIWMPAAVFLLFILLGLVFVLIAAAITGEPIKITRTLHTKNKVVDQFPKSHL